VIKIRNMAASACLMGIALSAGATLAAEFPQVSSQEHCTLEVSKMLDEAEQSVEYEKCMAQEQKFEPGARRLWTTLSEKQQKACLKYMFPPGKSYTNLALCMSSAIGMACMSGSLSCDTP
jgi:hypothetical protein